MNISSITSKGVKHEVVDSVARAKAEDNAQKIAESMVVNLQEKEATKNGEVVADDGFDGLSKVTVNVSSRVLFCAYEESTYGETYYSKTASLDAFTNDTLVYRLESHGGRIESPTRYADSPAYQRGDTLSRAEGKDVVIQ